MAQPTPFNRAFSFALFSAEFPTEQQSGVNLDAEFNAVKVTLDEILANIALIQDDDGALARGSVGRAQFDSSIELGFGPPSVWEASTEYDADIDTVFHANKFYICNADHTSGASFNASYWDELADFTLPNQLSAGDVTETLIANGAVTASKIGSNAVTAAKILNGAVSETKLATDAVTSAKILNGAVTLDKLAVESVSTTKVQDGAITEAKLATAVLATRAKWNDQTTTAAVDFPIGTVLAVTVSALPNRNTTSALYLDSGNTTGYLNTLSGAALTGTWKYCGGVGTTVALYQRSA